MIECDCDCMCDAEVFCQGNLCNNCLTNCQDDEGHLEYQCWICPWCYDDHSLQADCKTADLREEIKKLRAVVASQQEQING